MTTTQEVINQWPDSVRLKMIEKSDFYDNPTVYQYGFYDGYQLAYHEKIKPLLECLKIFIDKYDLAPDQQMSLGLVNSDFFSAKEAIKKATE